jgi:ribonucleotide reductase class II
MSFNFDAPTAPAVFYRSYSRRLPNGRREDWKATTERTFNALVELGKLSLVEAELLKEMQTKLITMPSGRWLWVGGTDWAKNPENFFGTYNCSSTDIDTVEAFGYLMNLAMQGCGTGSIMENFHIEKLPVIKNRLNTTIIGKPGDLPEWERRDKTELHFGDTTATIVVGDSRDGWVTAYTTLIHLAATDLVKLSGVNVDVRGVRPKGERLKGFGGVANPIKLGEMFVRVGKILDKALGRRLTSVECCLLADEAASAVVAGNIRRCLPENALVHTSKGLVPIRDVQVGDLVQTPLGFRKVTNKFDQGFQDVYEIETNSTYPRATLNHRLAVLSDAKGGYIWKKIQDILPGDRLLHNKQILPGTVTYLPPDFTETRPIQSRTAKTFVVPELTPEISWLIGYTHGNGYIAIGRNKYDKPYGRVEWSMNSSQPELAQKIQNKIDSVLNMFGLTAKHGIVKGENTARSVCSSIRLAEYFYHNIKKPKVTLSVPDFILQGSVEIRASYLAGLMDSDKALNNRPPHLVTSVYPTFIREVGAVLSSLGIAGRLSITQPQKSNWQAKYNLTLPALKDSYNNIISIHSVKGELKIGNKNFDFTIPKNMLLKQHSYSEIREMGFNTSISHDANYESYIAESDITLDIPVTVKALGSYDHIQTYDIEVEETHCFYCDGYLTHNSASIHQFSKEDHEAANSKDNLWMQDESGKWSIDPERDALRMANHTRVYHTKPTYKELLDACTKQYYSGEGAIQFAPEAIARANADLLISDARRRRFIELYVSSPESARDYLALLSSDSGADEKLLDDRMGRYGLNPCGEIVMRNNLCNLGEVHLNQIDPGDIEEQVKAFKSAAIAVCALLHHEFPIERYQYARKVDPIVGVSFTGVFDFFVKKFGAEWLQWWEQGRSDNHPKANYFAIEEIECLSFWKDIVVDTVQDYCHKQGLKVPNRCTTLQPAGCLDKTALRVFDQGLIYADEIVNPGSGEHDGIDLSVRNGISTNKVIANQPLNLVKVTLSNGRILRMTQNHRLSINGQWVYASDMQPGMKIDYSLGEYNKDSETSLIPLNYGDYTREFRALEKGHSRGVLTQTIKTPSTISPDLAYFLGCLFGNGCLSPSSTRVRFSHGHEEILNRLSDLGLKLFGIRGIISDDSRGQKKELTFGSKQLFDWLIMNNLSKKSKSKELDRIPYAIRTSSRDSILSFFCGLIDTDGCVKKAGSLSIDSASEKFLRNLQQIGEAVGLSFSIFHNTKGENMQAEKDMHGLCLSRMVSTSYAIEYLNLNSFKCSVRPLPKLKRRFKFDPYKIVSVDFETTLDYSYDFAVDGSDDNDSWYWQGCLKSHNSKSLLTGASPGWHPPKAARYIRRITFGKDDAIALALKDYGYNIVPSQSDKDENGQLLEDPFDPRCTEWLVEIPVEMPWANLEGCDQIDISKFSIEAQYSFYMQVQKFYVTHNASATLEIREHEIETLAKLLYKSIHNDEGYVSAAVLARFDSLETFPRLPFEPISKEVYDKMVSEAISRRKGQDFLELLSQHDLHEMEAFAQGSAACDSDKCMMPERKP